MGERDWRGKSCPLQQSPLISSRELGWVERKEDHRTSERVQSEIARKGQLQSLNRIPQPADRFTPKWPRCARWSRRFLTGRTKRVSKSWWEQERQRARFAKYRVIKESPGDLATTRCASSIATYEISRRASKKESQEVILMDDYRTREERGGGEEGRPPSSAVWERIDSSNSSTNQRGSRIITCRHNSHASTNNRRVHQDTGEFLQSWMNERAKQVKSKEREQTNKIFSILRV